MPLIIRIMRIEDYESITTLWLSVPGVGLSAADSMENIARYLERNPGLSFIACGADRLVGAVLCGHDGRRGYIHHLAVDPSYRRQGIGKALVTMCLQALQAEGIDKCHLFVFTKNQNAKTFWKEIGWAHRADLIVMSSYTQNF
ncbi:MAG: GNAT family N-acetyltransferase [Anaerolineales bacterium]|nr:MAG: GNAT family N-acetyltransferase [Anaerolineales bacterium]